MIILRERKKPLAEAGVSIKDILDLFGIDVSPLDGRPSESHVRGNFIFGFRNHADDTSVQVDELTSVSVIDGLLMFANRSESASICLADITSFRHSGRMLTLKTKRNVEYYVVFK
jgi:hypothetical protein